MSEKLSTKMELMRIIKTMTSGLIVLSCLWALWSFFYMYDCPYLKEVSANELILQWHLVYVLSHPLLRPRPRALIPHLTFFLHVSTAITPFTTPNSLTCSSSVGCFGLGYILDMKYLSQRRRAQTGLYTVVILNVAVYIWSIIMQTRFLHNNPGTIDWNDSLYPDAFLPYFSIQTTGPLSQSYIYWLLSSFASDAQGKFLFHPENPNQLADFCRGQTTSVTARLSDASRPLARLSLTA